MARTKRAPKRRRIEEEEAEQQAIHALLKAPQDQVEAAAAEATRTDCASWTKLNPNSSDKNEAQPEIPEWLTGLGVAQTIPEKHFQALQKLHQQIKTQVTTWTSWSGVTEDPRKRAFGFLPGTLGYETPTREQLDISTPWKKKIEGTEREQDERSRNHRAMVVLDEADVPLGIKEAIDYLCQAFASSLPKNEDSEHLKEYLQYSNLIAAQPNLHCGRELLPSHVDHPLKDGFGVVIITVSIVGSGIILLHNYTATPKATMQVQQGQAYMLADRSRNACAHGVVVAASTNANTTTNVNGASDTSESVSNHSHRESLNLRFGLHDFKSSHQGKYLPVVPSQQVLRYWENKADMESANKKEY